MVQLMLGLIPLAAYGLAVRSFHARRARGWPRFRIVAFTAGIASALAVIASPFDDQADRWFSAHMLQHLVLTDISVPLILCGGPILLALGAASPPLGRRIVALLQHRLVRILCFPLVTWAIFIVALWTIHFSPFFEAALDHEFFHVLEHAIYLTTASLFWLPIISVGPVPWSSGPLAFQIRMLYLIVAMPAEGFLGFSIYGARHVLYSHYAEGGVADQQTAGELMWIGSGLAMFVAFMLVGYAWAQHEQRAGASYDRLRNREPSAFVPVKYITQNKPPMPNTAAIKPSATGPR